MRGSKSEHGRDLPPAQTIPLTGLPGLSLSPSSLTFVSYINPSVRRLTTSSPPTIIWSWTLIPQDPGRGRDLPGHLDVGA